MMFKTITLFSGNANAPLAEEICNVLEVPLGKARVDAFSDGEIRVEIHENVRGQDTYLVQPTCAPVNKNLMELLIMIDALKRASARSITAVMPYYGYARQDRKVQPRTPITAKLVADLLQAAGATRVVAMDLHAGQIQGFFDIPSDNLYAMPVLLEYLREISAPDAVVVSPDAGGVERARAYAKRLGAGVAIIDKRRTAPNVAQLMNIVGDVKGRPCIIIDDMIDTAGTLAQAAEALKRSGATRVLACACHSVLSGPAVERIVGSCLEKVVTTNTIPLSAEAQATGRFEVRTVARIFGEAIKRIHQGDSLSSLFD